MKFKSLFLALLTIYCTATSAMDAREQQIQINVPTIYPDDACLRCHTLAQNVPQNKRCLTECCSQFICADDAQAILKTAANHNWTKRNINHQLTQMHPPLTAEQIKKMRKIALPKLAKPGICPNCNQKLSVDFNKGVSLKTPIERKPSITLIDTQNKRFELSPELSAALLKCETLHMYEDSLATKVPIDFSEIKDKPYLKQDLIIRLAQLIKDPVKETHRMKRDLELFECAHFLGAPDNIFYLIANELWPLMQEQANDTAPIIEYKKSIKLLAKPHFASLLQLREFINAQPYVYDSSNPSPYSHFYTGNLSSNALLTLPNRGWYQGKNNQWYRIYPFCTLDGIENFRPINIPINLTGHRLERIVSNILEGVNSQNENTNISFNLDNNPITCIDESFFQALAKRRAAGNAVELSFLNTRLSAQQKEEYKKKFDKATQTLPERYLSRFKFKSLVMGTSFIGTALALNCVYHKNPQLADTAYIISLIGAGAYMGGVAIGPITTFGSIFYGAIGTVIGLLAATTTPTRYAAGIAFGSYAASQLADIAALELAKRSHPELKGGDFFREDIIWKNNCKIIL